MNRSVFSISTVALFFLTVALALPVAIRPYWEATQHYKNGLKLLERRNYAEGLKELRKSLAWRSPFNTASEKSSRELYNISRSNSDVNISVSASEELWRGLQSSRSWYFSIPGTWRGISETNARQLLFEKFPPLSQQIKEEHQPQVFFMWQWISHVSLISWISLLFITIKRNFSGDGRLLTTAHRTLYVRLGAISVLWLIWIVALTKA
jgi:hypothetical protein